MENWAYGDVVPMPTLPALFTMKLVAVEEPMTKEGPVMPLGLTERRPKGEVDACPVNPALLIRKEVAEEEPTTNSLDAIPAVGLTERNAKGVAEATPSAWGKL